VEAVLGLRDQSWRKQIETEDLDFFPLIFQLMDEIFYFYANLVTAFVFDACIFLLSLVEL